jgi:hypothetical protein
MRYILRSLLIGAMFLSVLMFISSESPQVFAASRAPNLPTSINHAFYPPQPPDNYGGGSYSQNYGQGYQQGYSDCQQKLPPADYFDQGQGYSAGYNAGYQFCKNKRGQGQINGYQDGYQAGYSTCQSEHQKSFYSKTSPYNQGYGQGYQKGFQQGYNDCEASYNNNPSYKKY